MKKGHTGSEKAQELERRLDKLRLSQYKEDLKTLLGMPEGRRFLYRLIFEICHVEALSYGPDSDLKEGERNTGLTVMNELIDQHPESYMTMMIEMMKDRQDEFLKRKAARDDPDGQEE